jgi:hypothetical protein
MPPTPSERIWPVLPFRSGKFWAYSDSNSDHGISWAISTQRLSGDKLPPKGSSNSDGGFGASSTFRYTLAGGDARVLTYFTCLSCTLLSLARSHNLSPRQLQSIIQQALNRRYSFLWGQPERRNKTQSLRPDLR